MPAPATPTFILNWLNTWFKPLDRQHNASILASPTLADMTFVKTGGEQVAQPFTLNGYRGDSGDFQAAQAIASQSEFRSSAKYRWLVPYSEYVGSIQIPHRDMALSRTDRDAAAQAKKNEVEQAFKQRASNIMRLWFAAPGASMGVATLASGVATFTDRFAAAKIFQGDVVQFSATDGTSGSVLGSPGYVVKSESEIAAANTGRISVSQVSNGAVANPVGVVDGTYNVFRYGEFNSGNTNDKVIPIQAYWPAAPSTAELFNVKRTNDSRLSGCRCPDVQLAGKSIGSKVQQFIASLQIVAGTDGMTANRVVMNPLDWLVCAEEYGSTVSREVIETAEDGFSRITIHTANGATKVVADPHCPQGLAIVYDNKQLVMHSPSGMICEWLTDQSGDMFRRKESEPVFEANPISYLATVMNAPYAGGRFSTTI